MAKKPDIKTADLAHAPSTAYTGSAVSIVRKGSLYVPVMLQIDAGRVTEAKVGNGDVYQGAEIKAGTFLRHRAGR